MVKTRAQQSLVEVSTSGDEAWGQEIIQIKEDLEDLKNMKGEVAEIKRLLLTISGGISARRESC